MLITVNQRFEARDVQRELVARGLWVRRLDEGKRVRFIVEPHSAAVAADEVREIDGVESVAEASTATPRVDAQAGVVVVAGVPIGPGAVPVLMAGPCGVESEEGIHAAAARVAAAGARFLRGGAFKPRTSPYSFRGHGTPALRWMREAADANDLKVVTEAMDGAAVEEVSASADLIQIGSRNMQDFALLGRIGATGKPVLLKRGMAATVDEWLAAGEHLLVAGATAVVFCERGIRGFDPRTRNLLDLGAVALMSRVLGQPVVVDPSHASGRRDLVPTLARAALAAGAAGLLLETHPRPGDALSDGPQALLPEELARLSKTLAPAIEAGRSPR